MTTDRAKRYATNREVLATVYRFFEDDFEDDVTVDRKQLEWLRLKLNSFASAEHGTVATYVKGCHCNLCRAARAVYRRDWCKRHPG
jgi:hypothetical protein